MKNIVVRTIGITLIVAGIVGLVVSIGGIIALAQAEKQVEATLMEHLDLVDRSLSATADGLAVADSTLSQAAAATGTLEGFVDKVSLSIDGTIPTVDAVANLLGGQVPGTIEATQETLTTVASSAEAVDTFLTVITSIPLLGLERYNPEGGLSQGVEQVVESLDGIPQSLELAGEGLRGTGSGLEEINREFSTMAGTVSQITTSLEDAQEVLKQYQDVVADLQSLVGTLSEDLPQWLRILRLGLSVILIWLGIAQLGLITQGWELIARSRGSSPPSA
jgi:uncharacterized phage infection (PIP) family protein YhgE